MPHDVFVWLLAVALLKVFVWQIDSETCIGRGNGPAHAALWRYPLVDAYWQAERARWAEEERRQDAMGSLGSLRLDLPPDEMLAAEPPAPPGRHPDVSPEDEAMLLSWGSTSPRAPRTFRRTHRIRLGPRAADVFSVNDGHGASDGWFWGEGR